MAYTTINKQTDYFNTKLYTGTGSSLALTGVGFQPDLTWIKSRSDTYNNQLFDSVRGTTKSVVVNEANAEITISGLTAFGADGFTVGTDAQTNGSGATYASWNWKGGTTSIPSSGQSLEPTAMSYNATSGVSIIKYDSTDTNPSTIPHGLGVTPEMVIFKNLDDSTNWLTYHKGLSSNKYLYLNSTDAESGSTDYIEVSSSLITLKTTWTAQNNGSNFMCYAFAPVAGYSKFGTYKGNGNADGTFVYTGFKPSFVIFKRATTSGASWCIIDTVRQPYNTNTLELPAANLDSAEATGSYQKDFLSNGFKMRSATDNFNKDGDTYIYMAFGQSLVGTNNTPATAK